MSITKIQIKHRFTAAVLFECDAPDGLASGLHTRYALERAAKARADLAGANLARADLAGANLARADLAGANLAWANLAGADLARADLAGANLAWADLAWANLAWAYLARADLAGARLIGERPIFQIGPIGSRCAYFTSYLTDQGIKLRAGCFFGTVAEFREKLCEEHGANKHANEYDAALTLIQAHADLWMPAEVEQSTV
jgi:hypothetical protein